MRSGSSRHLGDQSHSARYQMGEVTIHYRFHPYAGRSMPVIGRNVRAGVAVVTVRQPDDTAAYIPEWMIHPEAKRLNLRSQPRLPLGCLRDLRDVVGAILRMLAGTGESDNGGAHVIARNPTDSISAELVPPTPAASRSPRVGSWESGSVTAAPAAGNRAEDGGPRRKRDRL